MTESIKLVWERRGEGGRGESGGGKEGEDKQQGIYQSVDSGYR